MNSFIKKALSLVMAGTMSLTLLTACGEAQDDSVDQIRANAVVKVAIPDVDTSLLYYDSEVGQYRGTEAEVIDVISASLGVPAEFIKMPKADLVNAVNMGTADLAIGCIREESDSLENLASTVSYANESIYVVSPRGVYVGDLTVFKNQKIGVSSIMDAKSYSEAYYSGASEIFLYDDSDSVASALRDGSIAGYLCYKSEALYLTSTGEFQAQTSPDLPAENYVIAMLPGKTYLLSGCNGLIQSYVSGESSASWVTVSDNEATSSGEAVEETITEDSLFN